MSDLAALTLAEAAAAFARGEATAEALVRACLARIDRRGAALNAVIRLDREGALAAAAAQDRARAGGVRLGPLAGVPMLHKDMFYRAGRVSTCGSAIRRDYVPMQTATVLQRLDAAGALDLGTLNMAEFAQNPTGHNAHFGAARNPYDLARCPGGSSSGSGAAVAARLCFAALGSDTGGSIRMPASMCGLTGLKPTHGRVSRAGAMPLSHSLDTIGPLARTARDAALLLRVLAGADPADPASASRAVPDYAAALDGDLRGQRIGVLDDMTEGADPVVRAAFDAAMAVLRDRGAAVARLRVPSLPAIHALGALVSRVEGATLHAGWMRDRPGDYAPHLSARLYVGLAIPGHLYNEALARRGALLRRFVAEALTAHDLVACPTLRTPVPTLAETDIDADPAHWAAHMALSLNTRPFNYLGLPSISVPCGRDGAGVPIGLQLTGRPFAEARVLRVADGYQQATEWHRMAPPGD